MDPHPFRVRSRASALLPAVAAVALAAPAADAATHHRHSNAVRAARHAVAAAEATLARDARTLGRCMHRHAARPGRCGSAVHALDAARARLSGARQRLAQVARTSSLATTSSIRIALTPERTGAVPVGVPLGTASVLWAYMPSLSSQGSEVHYLWPRLQPTASFTPPAGYRVVDAIAFNAQGGTLGSWSGRLQTESPLPVGSITSPKLPGSGGKGGSGGTSSGGSGSEGGSGSTGGSGTGTGSTPPPPPPGSIQIALTTNKVSVQATSEPTGTAGVRWAYMPSISSSGGEIHYATTSVTTFTPPSADPVVDAIALDSSSATIGSWAGRVTTTPEAAAPPPPPPPPPSPTPTGKLVVSLNAGGWGINNEQSDLGGVVNTLRVEDASGEALSGYAGAGFHVIDLVNHYSTSGVQSINREAFANEALARAQAHPNIVATEIENEPQNPYFWGSSSESAASIEGYAALVNVVAAKFAAAYASDPAAMPKLLWSADGGFRGVSTWGRPVYEHLSAQARELTYPTVHPYGGTVERLHSAEGNRARVTEAHELTGKPVWVTEIGWPTALGQPNTGDSMQWSEAEQAANIEHFVEWAAAYGGVGDVSVFCYRDYSTNDWYGIESHEGKRKSSYYTLKSLSATYGA